MSKVGTSGWVMGAVALILAILLGTYFLVASPRLQAAAETAAAADQIRAENDILTVQTARLRADFARLDEYRTEVAALQVQIPAAARLPEYTRALVAAAEANGVVITEILASPPVLVTIPEPPVPAAPPPTDPAAAPAEATEEAAPDTEMPAEGEEVPAPVPAGVPQIEGFVSVPLGFKVTGPHTSAIAFLHQVQTGTERLYLVTQLGITAREEAAASGGLPAIPPGEVEIAVLGSLYVLKPPALPAAAPVAGEEQPVRPPLPSTDRNPFLPLTGTAGPVANAD